MKRIILASLMLLILSASLNAQWYTKKYQVTDINALSLDQLQESLKESNQNMFISLGVVGFGGLMVLAGLYLPYEVNEDSPFLEQVIGSKGMSYLITFLGAGCAIVGTISTFEFLGRSSKIRSTMKKNYPVTGYMNISPAIMFNRFSRTSCAGVSLTINF